MFEQLRSQRGWQPRSGRNIDAWGLNTNTTGTVGSATPGSSSQLDNLLRSTFTTAGTAGASAGIRSNAAQFARQTGAGLGGFRFKAVVAIISAISDQRGFWGLTSNTGAPANSNPSSLTTQTLFGIGHDSGDTNLQVMSNDGSTSVTKTSLGANFPAKTANCLYTVEFYCPPGGASIDWKVTRHDSAQFASGSQTTDLPSAGTTMCPKLWINNGATASPAQMDLVSFLLETNGP